MTDKFDIRRIYHCISKILETILILIGLFVVFAAVVAMFDAYGGDLSTQTEQPWYVVYFFNLLALLVSPIAGFAAGQWYKALHPINPPSLHTGVIAGCVTAALSTWLWPGTLNESFKIGVLVGFIQPFLVWGWFAIAARVAPEQVQSLKGRNGDITVLPWVRTKRHDRRARPRKPEPTEMDNDVPPRRG